MADDAIVNARFVHRCVLYVTHASICLLFEARFAKMKALPEGCHTSKGPFHRSGSSISSKCPVRVGESGKWDEREISNR